MIAFNSKAIEKDAASKPIALWWGHSQNGGRNNVIKVRILLELVLPFVEQLI